MDVLSAVFKSWHPGIGDPTISGWLTVLVYLLGAYFSRAYSRDFRSVYPLLRTSYEYIFWISITIFLVLLAVNKQLDLQVLFTLLGRELSRSNGWADFSRTYHAWSVISVMIVSAGLIILSVVMLLDVLKKYILALIGLTLLFIFILVRAASFNHINWFFGLGNSELFFNFLLENSGTILIAWSALLNRKRLAVTGDMQPGI